MAVYSASGSVSLYTNGALSYEADQGIISTLFNSSSELMIGAQYEPTSELYRFNGVIDDLRIYNRAVSADEVTALYQE